jgi:hypothetical protein
MDTQHVQLQTPAMTSFKSHKELETEQAQLVEDALSKPATTPILYRAANAPRFLAAPPIFVSMLIDLKAINRSVQALPSFDHL